MTQIETDPSEVQVLDEDQFKPLGHFAIDSAVKVERTGYLFNTRESGLLIVQGQELEVFLGTIFGDNYPYVHVRPFDNGEDMRKPVKVIKVGLSVLFEQPPSPYLYSKQSQKPGIRSITNSSITTID